MYWLICIRVGLFGSALVFALSMLALHGIVNEDDGIVIHFCTFRTFRYFAKVLAHF